MSDLVDPAQVETIVGVQRHPTDHYGRAVSAEQRVYILHSQQCKDTYPNLRDCPFSLAMDQGIDTALVWFDWQRAQDRPVKLEIWQGYLRPAAAQGGAAR